MALILRKQHTLALVILAFLALVVVSLLLFSAVAHVDIWHYFGFVHKLALGFSH